MKHVHAAGVSRQGSTIKVRHPIVAGQFYPSARSACEEALQDCVAVDPPSFEPETELLGAIVPHAGWTCSGKVTGQVFRALADWTAAETVVLIGAVHAVKGRTAALYGHGAWQTPLGRVVIDEALAGVLTGRGGWIENDPQAHQAEHSLEVQVPFVQKLFPDAKILPLLVPPSPLAPRIGELVGQVLGRRDARVVVVGTSDLTHYGPSYALTSHGVGQDGLDWAKDVNDRRMIDRMLALDAVGVVPEAAHHHNACGSGAIAATIAACKLLGAQRAVLLQHTTSQEVLRGMVPEPATDAVGYAGIVFCK